MLLSKLKMKVFHIISSCDVLLWRGLLCVTSFILYCHDFPRSQMLAWSSLHVGSHPNARLRTNVSKVDREYWSLWMQFKGMYTSRRPCLTSKYFIIITNSETQMENPISKHKLNLPPGLETDSVVVQHLYQNIWTGKSWT